MSTASAWRGALGATSVPEVRVIGGSARGRRLLAPEDPSVRPTSDRVREAIFDVLEHLGAVRGARVLDLFAGSGALGIEALSRGASAVTFVEQNPRALKVIEANLSRTQLRDAAKVEVVRADALSYLAQHKVHVELALCDPPYAFSSWQQLLAHLDARVLVLESDRAIELVPSLQLHRVYRYGGTLVTVARQLEESEDAGK